VVTESGCDVPDESNLDAEAAVHDAFRVEFYRGYLAAAMQAKNVDGVRLEVRNRAARALPGGQGCSGPASPEGIYSALKSYRTPYGTRCDRHVKHTWAVGTASCADTAPVRVPCDVPCASRRGTSHGRCSTTLSGRWASKIVLAS